jgi:spore coat protein U-like protein
VGAVNSYTFSNIQANHTLSASFVQTTYTVSVTAGANGSISYGTVTIPAGSTQNIIVNCGDQPTFTFHPNNGYQISDVVANSVSVGTPGSYQFLPLAEMHHSMSHLPKFPWEHL